MSLAAPVLPGLTVVTTPLDDPGGLIPLLDREHPLLWLRRGQGMIGIGEALRLEFTGPTRFADAARAWREVASAARVDDSVGLAGTGLIAFGAFAFDDTSSATSVLIVPRLVLGRRDGRAWLTRVDGGEEPPAPREWAPSRAEFAAGTLGHEGYVAAVERAIELIRSDGVSKVVVARDLEGTLKGTPHGALERLADGYPDCWTFCVDGFLGSSPETLVSVSGGRVTARVLAGSAARGADAASDVDASVALVTSTKDQDEHEFAVQSVLAALRGRGADVRASEVPFTLKLPNLWHLASDVEGTLDDGSTSLDLIEALHPTAAVAGTPTPAAVALIRELEPFDRERYAGPVGWVGADGDGEWAIALRCAQVYPGGRMRAWAGAGIVIDSDSGHELAETSMKFRPVLDAFGA